MRANADIYLEHDRWGRALAWSAGFHVAIMAGLLIYSAFFYRTSGDVWGSGSGGEAIGATLVSTIPLPANPAQTQNVLATESKGLTQSQPKIEEKAPDAIEIQGKNTKIKPKKKQETASKQKPLPAPEEETNPVACGEGGPVRGPSAQRVYITFDVARDGHPTNVQVEQSSGVPSLDISAVRALQRIDTFGPLPADYSGNKISVEYWFDYKK